MYFSTQEWEGGVNFSDCTETCFKFLKKGAKIKEKQFKTRDRSWILKAFSFANKWY